MINSSDTISESQLDVLINIANNNWEKFFMKKAAILVTLGLFTTSILTPLANAKADSTQGVDWSKYQNNDGVYGYPSDTFVFSQIGGVYGSDTQGYNVQSTYASQVRGALSNGKHVHTYIWFQVGGNQPLAERALDYFLPKIQTPKGSIIALDYESGASGDIKANTNAIMYAMQRIRAAGYVPMLYSGNYYLRTYVNASQIVSAFGNCLWIADYPYNGVVTTAPNAYKPNVNGLAIWQFTSNYRPGGLDGSVDYTGITNSGYGPSAGSQPSQGTSTTPNTPTTPSGSNGQLTPVSSATSNALQNAIANARLYTRQFYTPSSYAALQNALTQAVNMVNAGTGSENDYVAMLAQLNNAMASVVRVSPVIDAGTKAALDNSISLASLFTPSYYVPASYATLANALTQAKNVRSFWASTSAQYQAATQSLNAAINGVQRNVPVIDQGTKNALNNAIADASQYTSTYYTPASYATLQQAINQAKGVQNFWPSTSAQYVAATQALQNAMNNIVRVVPVIDPQTRAQLNQAIYDASLYTPKYYVPSTFAPMANALANARAVRSFWPSTQAQYVAATKNLVAAMNGVQRNVPVISPSVQNALKAAISSAQVNLSGAKNTTSSQYGALQNALTNAQNVVGFWPSTQDQYAAALSTLTNALNNYTNGNPASASMVQALNSAYAAAKLYTPSYYTPASYATLAQALQNGAAVLANPNGSATQYQQATQSLNAAMNNIVRIVPVINGQTRAQLNEAIYNASLYTPSYYVPSSFAPLADALAKARAVTNYWPSTQAQYAAAIQNLNAAMNNVVRIVPAVSAQAKSNLNAAIAAASAYTPSYYTAASYNNLKTALVAGKAVVSYWPSTQAQYVAAANALQQAMDNIVRVK